MHVIIEIEREENRMINFVREIVVHLLLPYEMKETFRIT